ncbi:MAG: OmpH family outer membrane protein [Planctomycetota bacterium]
MNSIKLLAAGLLVLLVAAMLPEVRLLARPAPQAGAMGTVAVVDLFRVLSEAKPFAREQEAIRRWIDTEKRTNLEVKKSEIEAREADLELLEGDPVQHRALLLEQNIAKVRFDHEYEYLEKERLRRITRGQRAAFDGARKAISEYATSHGISLVVQSREGPLEGLNQGELTSEMYLRDVLYAEASLDITDSVITILNTSR